MLHLRFEYERIIDLVPHRETEAVALLPPVDGFSVATEPIELRTDKKLSSVGILINADEWGAVGEWDKAEGVNAQILKFAWLTLLIGLELGESVFGVTVYILRVGEQVEDSSVRVVEYKK